MTRSILTTIVAAALMAGMLVRPAPAATPGALFASAPDQPTTIHQFEAALAAEKDPIKQQALADKIELLHHQMGPLDPTGARNHAKASAHDAMIEALDGEIRGYQAWPKTGGELPAGVAARLQVRRMAQACLTYAWALNDRAHKYQFDVFGQYLANNTALLDDLLDSTAAFLTKPAPAGTDPAAYTAAVAQAREALGKLTAATDRCAGADMADPKTALPAAAEALGQFAESLRNLKEAHEALRGLTGKTGKPDAPAAKPDASAAKAEEPGSPSDTDKENIEKIREVVAALGADASWKKVHDDLDHLATVGEQGLELAAARAEARDLLAALAAGADYLQGLLKSKSATPQLIDGRRKTIESALAYISSKPNRPRGLAMIRRMPAGDHVRLVLDSSPLSPEAAQGIMAAQALVPPTPDDRPEYNQLHGFVQTVIDTLDRQRDGPPKAMGPPLLDFYKRAAATFTKGAETAGRTSADPMATLLGNFEVAATAAGDVTRIVRVDQAIRSASQISVANGAKLQTELVGELRVVVGATTTGGQRDRQLLDNKLGPLLGLADLQFPTSEHMRVVTAITGPGYTTALNQMNQLLLQGIQEALRGYSFSLASAQDIGWIFRALRHRGVVQTSAYARTSVANMDDFSMSEKIWTRFLAAYDAQLRTLLAQYTASADRRTRPPVCQGLSNWDAVFACVAWEQRQTLAGRPKGESDLDFLLRNLTAVTAPNPTNRTCFGWAVGYHAAEAATAMAAGFDGTAAWHRQVIYNWRQEDDFAADFLIDTLDPAK